MRFVFILFSIISFSAFGIEYDSIRSERRTEGLFVIHEVEDDETLFSLARRYGSSVNLIIDFNEISDNRIEIGQVLSVLIEEKADEEDSVAIAAENEELHLIEAGETLYSISKKYDVKIRDLIKWNRLEDNSISPGEYLRISENDEETNGEEHATGLNNGETDSDTVLVAIPDEELIPEGFELYHVQTAETLNSISRKRKVSVDSIKYWNNLNSDYLRIGQKLFLRIPSEVKNLSDSTEAITRLNEDGFERVYKEGTAAVIQGIKTSKFLALHRTLPIGTELEVRNLMNNLVVHVKIIGKLPDTGVNKNLLVRLSRPVFDRLGILDSKSRVEVSHFK